MKNCTSRQALETEKAPTTPCIQITRCYPLQSCPHLPFSVGSYTKNGRQKWPNWLICAKRRGGINSAKQPKQATRPIVQAPSATTSSLRMARTVSCRASVVSWICSAARWWGCGRPVQGRSRYKKRLNSPGIVSVQPARTENSVLNFLHSLFPKMGIHQPRDGPSSERDSCRRC